MDFVARIDLNSLSVDQVTPIDEALSSSMCKNTLILLVMKQCWVVWMDNRAMLNDCFLLFDRWF